MTERRTSVDLVIAIFLAVLFLAIAGFMWSPFALNFLSRAGEINTLFEPYLSFMAILAVVNAALILALVPICRKAFSWFAKLSVLGTVALSTFIVAEVGAAVAVKKLFNFQHVGSRYTNGFEFNPGLGFTLKPNFSFQLQEGNITHTAEGYRGPEAPVASSDGQKTVLMIGGSTTYDLDRPDDQTWPAVFGRLFGDQVRVVNMGIPGHATPEHIALASLVASEYQPDAILYYIGWNDVRSSHVDETADYSKFHKKGLYRSFGIHAPRSFFALGFIVKKVLATLDEISLENLSKFSVASKIDGSVDERLLDMYTRNVGILNVITREIGAVPIFVPQVLNEAQLKDDRGNGWTPHVPETAMPAVLATFNDAMMQTTSKAGATVIPEVLSVDWQDADFIDSGHFSQGGAERFACAVATGFVNQDVIAPSSETASMLASQCDGVVIGNANLSALTSN